MIRLMVDNNRLPTTSVNKCRRFPSANKVSTRLFTPSKSRGTHHGRRRSNKRRQRVTIRTNHLLRYVTSFFGNVNQLMNAIVRFYSKRKVVRRPMLRRTRRLLSVSTHLSNILPANVGGMTLLLPPMRTNRVTILPFTVGST